MAKIKLPSVVILETASVDLSLCSEIKINRLVETPKQKISRMNKADKDTYGPNGNRKDTLGDGITQPFNKRKFRCKVDCRPTNEKEHEIISETNGHSAYKSFLF